MRVFLTGASSGIGEALAVEYAQRHGAALEIGLVARREAELERVAARLGSALVQRFVLDVNDRDALFAAADAFHAGGPVDVVVANAGISSGTAAGQRDDAPIVERIVRTNLIALADTFAPFVTGMRARGAGRLVGIASVAGVRGLPGSAPYSASKAGAIRYCESLRVELRATGVKVVTIAPGYIATPMTEKNRYPMPFLMAPAAFARRTVDAIERGSAYRVIPWQMAWVARLLHVMPRPLYDTLFARAPRKGRTEQPQVPPA